MRKLIISAFMFTLLLLSFSSARRYLVDVEEISYYKTTVNMTSPTIAHITKKIVIRNIIDRDIVPGYAYLYLSKIPATFYGKPSNERKAVNVMNLRARTDTGIKLETSLKSNTTTTIIRYGIWLPLAPNETITVYLSYDIEGIADRGILFYNVVAPLESSSIPIRKYDIEVIPPKGYFVSYAPDGKKVPMSSEKAYLWSDKSAIMQYSRIPMVPLPVPGSIVFWVALIMIIFIWGFSDKLKKVMVGRQ